MQPDMHTVNELSGVRLRVARGPEDCEWELPEPLLPVKPISPVAISIALMFTSACVLLALWVVS